MNDSRKEQRFGDSTVCRIGDVRSFRNEYERWGSLYKSEENELRSRVKCNMFQQCMLFAESRDQWHETVLFFGRSEGLEVFVIDAVGERSLIYRIAHGPVCRLTGVRQLDLAEAGLEGTGSPVVLLIENCQEPANYPDQRDCFRVISEDGRLNVNNPLPNGSFVIGGVLGRQCDESKIQWWQLIRPMEGGAVQRVTANVYHAL